MGHGPKLGWFTATNKQPPPETGIYHRRFEHMKSHPERNSPHSSGRGLFSGNQENRRRGSIA
jgi:hypothetical protein